MAYKVLCVVVAVPTLIFSLASCEKKVSKDGGHHTVNRLSDKDYGVYRDLYFPNSLDTNRPLKMLANVGHLGLTNFLSQVKFSVYLRDSIGLSDNDIEEVVENCRWDYEVHQDFVDTTFTLDENLMGKGVVLLSRDSLIALREKKSEYSVTLISEPLFFQAQGLLILFERYESAERVLLYHQEAANGTWTLKKVWQMEHDI